MGYHGIVKNNRVYVINDPKAILTKMLKKRKLFKHAFSALECLMQPTCQYADKVEYEIFQREKSLQKYCSADTDQGEFYLSCSQRIIHEMNLKQVIRGIWPTAGKIRIKSLVNS